MTLEVRELQGGVRFGVRAVPGSSREGLRGLYGGRLRVAVHAPPERGRANARLCELLAEVLGVPQRAISIERGSTGRDKQVAVQGLSADELRARVARALG